MKVYLITGGSDGIGAELARQLAARSGANIGLMLVARSIDKLEAVAADCRAFGTTVFVQSFDVRDESQCHSVVDNCMAHFGKLDVLVNNAGMSAHAYFDEVTNLDWYRQLMEINFWGSVYCTHAALPHLKASRGQIVAVSSHAGLFGVPGRTSYSATKFAMQGFFDCLRIELKPHHVAITTVYPGVVATDIRSSGFGKDGKPMGESSLKENNIMSLKACAGLILKAMDGRKREHVMTFKARLGRYLKLLAPARVDALAQAAVKQEHTQN